MFLSKPFNITAIQVYDSTINTEEAEIEQLYEDLQDLLQLTLKKDVLFTIRGWNAKVGSQEIPGVSGTFSFTKRSRSKANRVLPRKHTGHSNHHLPTTQEETLDMEITRWSIPKSD